MPFGSLGILLTPQRRLLRALPYTRGRHGSLNLGSLQLLAR